VACRRPTVIAGGELTLEMLDLQFNEYSKFYEAPLHVKAMGGTFLIDDLGRQLVEPEALLNRWITPLEKRLDYLTLSSGRTFTLPFDVLVIFATNLTPDDLMDPAFLRRIAYKVQIHQPTEEHYRRVFRMLCDKHNVPFDESVANFAMDKIQNVLNQPLAFYQPRFIVEQIIAACKYEGTPPRMDIDLLIDALDNISLEEGLIAPESTTPLTAS
jgi:SpoVK/Ycf46/Vps4 family AAA+-type ATPase